jgi:hypothetical protein
MTAFSGDSIALTFTADLSSARASYDQFIADVARRPIPIQFQGGGAAAAVGASIPNAPGVGGAGQWAAGATASAAAISGRGIIQGPGAGAVQPPPLPAAGGGTLNAGTVTINAGTVNIVGNAAGGAEGAAAAGGEDAPGVGGARRRGGGGLGGLGSNRMIFALGIAAAAQVAHSSDAYEDALFSGSMATNLGQYAGSKAARWQAISSGPAGQISRFAIDALSGTGPAGYLAAASPLGGLAQLLGGNAIGVVSPTRNIQAFEAQAFAAQAGETMFGLDARNSAERMVRSGYAGGLASGGLLGASRGMAEAEIRAHGWLQRSANDEHIRQLSQIQREERALGIDATTPGARGDNFRTRATLIGTYRDSNRGSEAQENFNVMRLQAEQRQQDSTVTTSITRRQAGARLRAGGQFGAAEGADLDAQLDDMVDAAYREHGPAAGAAARVLAGLTRAGDAAETQSLIARRAAGSRSIQRLIARDSLGSVSEDLAGRRDEELRHARPEQYAGINDFYEKQWALAKQRDADVRTINRGRLNVDIAGLQQLVSGPGTYGERSSVAEALGIYGQGLLDARADVTGNQGRNLDKIRQRAGLQVQSLQQQLLAGFRAEEVDLNRVAVSNPQDSLQQIGKIAEDVAKIPSKLDDIQKSLDGFDQVQ